MSQPSKSTWFLFFKGPDFPETRIKRTQQSFQASFFILIIVIIMHKNYVPLIVLVLLHINPLPEFITGVRGAKFRCIERERRALLQFKEDLIDDYGVLSSWGGEEEKRDCCKWRGVGCDNITGHVTLLDLHSSPVYDHHFKPLIGKVSDSLLELQYLNYLDLSLNNFDESMMDFIGSLTSLRYLNLSYNFFTVTIPCQLGNLSRLQSLDLSYSFDASVENLDWLSHLSSLERLDLSGSNLSKVNDWLQVITNLPRLKELRLNQCSLPDIIPSPLSFANSSKFLAVLHLSNNNLSSAIYPWLYNFSKSLVDLDLSGNQLKGSIPDAFRNMSALTNLVLSGNQLEGGIPRSLGEMCSLHVLDLCHNHISEDLSDLVQNLYGRTESSLEILRLCQNQLHGSLPDIARFSSLRELDISYNLLNGRIPESIGFLSKLEHFDVSFNSFQGVVSGEHFSNLSKLQNLDLSYNSLVLRFKSDWDPTFQLNTIRLSSCNLGPFFPRWLRTQRNAHLLDISSANISDKIPNWFWNLLPTLAFLNLSHNLMRGTLPDLLSVDVVDGTFPGFDLSFNLFEGLLPAFPSTTSSLILSNNLFSGPISHICNITGEILSFLDLSNNLLSGQLPNCFTDWKGLVVLNLANNNLSGKIPSSVGSLFLLQTLSLHNNKLHGELPVSLKNCSMLKFLDLGENRLSGEIPAWIGESLSSLMFLSLQSNEFLGSIPPHICQLRNIRILDLSLNNITGAIPECLNNLTAMVLRGEAETVIDNLYLTKRRGAVFSGGYYINKAWVGWKGRDYEFERTLGLLRVIDFSGNNLSGEIPEEITGLLGLVALNLSGNNLTGVIPQKIGQLTFLESLDLSRNHFYGAIPFTMAVLNFLSCLNVSYNNLSGKIPLSTQLQSFDASAFTGNPALCGPPFTKKCLGDVDVPQRPVMNDVIQDNKKTVHEFSMWFYIGMENGFFVFFIGFSGALLLKHSWRHGYFQFLDESLEFLCLILRAHKAKQKRPHPNSCS
ncbi:receptor-like protein EIX2 isoform X1 [Populus nigra]|uniref:receptor-like protein EIX2 isoform X1 n=1 Tax=Populus nigra TaxID=3691 RepID=UPI002B269272|nr:receptor-like protein EIX2 isoform X1 [Populus nigra]